jgi:hypothetical protein
VDAGLNPAYTGGPFNYLSQRSAAEIRSHAHTALAAQSSLFVVPDSLDSLAARSAAASVTA